MDDELNIGLDGITHAVYDGFVAPLDKRVLGGALGRDDGLQDTLGGIVFGRRGLGGFLSLLVVGLGGGVSREVGDLLLGVHGLLGGMVLEDEEGGRISVLREVGCISIGRFHDFWLCDGLLLFLLGV